MGKNKVHNELSTRKQPSILVVDGSGVSRTLLSRILRLEMGGATITTCGSVQEALSHLDGAKYDLITTSLVLPDMDGLELCQRIRKIDRHRFTPVIVISGDANERLLREGFAAGVTDYFDKSRGYIECVEFIKAFSMRNLGLVGRVLCVEDSPTTAAIARSIMEKQGLQVLHVTSAEQAIELLERSASEFDVVLTDLSLDGKMTGEDLLQLIRLKLHYSLQELPVLIMTADTHQKKHIEMFLAGTNDVVIKPLVQEIFMARVRALLMIKQQHMGLLRQAEEMKHLATTDSLTGVRSKRYLLDKGEGLLANPDNHPLWALIIDIDYLKIINDKRGNLTGDHVLAALGGLLKRHFPGDSMVVRFGGEEFSVLIPRCLRAEAYPLVEALRVAIETLRPMDIDVTVSIGMAGNEDHPGVNLNQLVALADKALYAAKEAGRNCVYVGLGEGPQRLQIEPD